MRVLIADDHALVRHGLRTLLTSSGIEVVSEAENGQRAVELAHELHPDIVLMDLTMPVMNGLTATRLITADLPDIKVIVVTASEDDEDLFDAVRSGAQGYLLKHLDPDRFIDLLSRVEQGEPAFSPSLARKMLTEFGKPAAAPPSNEALTEREREVLELLVSGITSSRELAATLVVSESTVKFHLRNIMTKLHLQNRSQVVAYALRHGLARNEP